MRIYWSLSISSINLFPLVNPLVDFYEHHQQYSSILLLIEKVNLVAVSTQTIFPQRHYFHQRPKIQSKIVNVS